jgi:hypothetical protein
MSFELCVVCGACPCCYPAQFLSACPGAMYSPREGSDDLPEPHLDAIFDVLVAQQDRICDAMDDETTRERLERWMAGLGVVLLVTMIVLLLLQLQASLRSW